MDGEGVDPWREQVWQLLLTLSEPIQVLCLLAALTLGAVTVKAIT